MVADALHDILKDSIKRKQILPRTVETAPNKNVSLFEEYLQKVDINLVKRGMCFKPAKSVEFGKTDQSMLNHLRNGILFLLRFNDALKKFNISALDEKGLRECMALFTMHELHKLEFEEFKDEPEGQEIEYTNSAEQEFEIPKDIIIKFIKDFGVLDFAPQLTEDDYYSVAVALHKSRFSRSGARTSRFMDYEPFLYLMDNMASCKSPEEAVSIRSLKALHDGFPQNSADEQLNLQYHKLDDIKGILTGIINKSVADNMEESGLVMLMAYENGCVYLGKGQNRETISDKKVEKIYEILIKNIQNSSPALSNIESLGKNLGRVNLGYYIGLSDEYFFFSDPKIILRTYISTPIISGYTDKNKGRKKKQEIEEISDDEKKVDSVTIGINKISKIVPITLEKTDEGRKILIGFARAIATVHKHFIAEMIHDNKQALIKTCDLWKVPDILKNALLQELIKNTSNLTSGGKWDYSYAIAQTVIDLELDGVKLRNTDVNKTINYLIDYIWTELTSMEQWNAFISNKIDAYRKEFIEYFYNTLTINGAILHIEKSLLSDVFHEYETNGKICNLCNRGTILTKKKMENSNSFLSFNFSNRVFVGKSKPTNIYTCIPCGVELALRLNGFNPPKGKALNSEMLYFHLIPDYFFTPESWDMAKSILLKFSDEARIRMVALANKIFNSQYVGKSDTEGDFDVYDSWLKDLAVIKDENGKSGGMDMTQYMAQGYGNMIGNASIIFYKPSENTTEFHFFGAYVAIVIAAYTGMRVVVSPSPIPSIRGSDFNEMIALDSINSHVVDFYGEFISLSQLETKLRMASALIRLGYNTSSNLRDSLFPKYLRAIRNEKFPGSYLLKMVYRGSEEKFRDRNVKNLLDEALFLDNVIQR
jgi:CRISPR-associated protein Csc3